MRSGSVLFGVSRKSSAFIPRFAQAAAARGRPPARVYKCRHFAKSDRPARVGLALCAQAGAGARRGGVVCCYGYFGRSPHSASPVSCLLSCVRGARGRQEAGGRACVLRPASGLQLELGQPCWLCRVLIYKKIGHFRRGPPLFFAGMASQCGMVLAAQMSAGIPPKSCYVVAGGRAAQRWACVRELVRGRAIGLEGQQKSPAGGRRSGLCYENVGQVVFGRSPAADLQIC